MKGGIKIMSANSYDNAGLRVGGKIALVTGAGSGIGQAAAIRLAEEGAKLVLLDMHADELEETRAIIESIGLRTADYLLLAADIADENQVREAAKAIAERWGKLDVLFANAGINGVMSPIEDFELNEWNKTIGINLTGTFLCVKHAIPLMKKAGGGSIAITSSVNGNRIFSGFGYGAYSTSKAGQVAFSQMAALELARYGIRVNAICPGAIETNIGENTDRHPEVDEITIPVEYPEGSQPLSHRSGKPRQVANVVLFLASDESDHVTGTVIYVDGAESLLRG
jgi:NAD(P)-dependent dehydrogenase (short-subunit alcohol dehydrogenase family)